MSEKRFEVINARWQGKGEAVAFEDTHTNQVYFAENQEECKRIVGLLNDFALTIDKLDEDNTALLIENRKLKEENEQLRKENTALDKENAEHLADNIKELDLLEKLTKFLHECDLTNEQRALFHDMITEEDLQPNLEVE